MLSPHTATGTGGVFPLDNQAYTNVTHTKVHVLQLALCSGGKMYVVVMINPRRACA